MGQQQELCRLSITAREIQAPHASEAAALARIRRQLEADQSITAARFDQEVGRLIDGGGRSWILYCESMVVGYASISPTPGLPGLYVLDGFISPAFHRQRLATALLRAILNDLTGSAVRQLYHAVTSLDSPAAKFLLASDFFVEHEERFLVRDRLDRLPAVKLLEPYVLRTLPRKRAISRFRRLYESGFSGLPWYQPFESAAEVAADLVDADDLLFLDHGSQPAGFLWLRWPDLQLAEIEPVGILPPYQGQGLGRQLMLAGIARAADQGAKQVRVGVWQQNVVALALYERLGFRETYRRHYLACNLAP